MTQEIFVASPIGADGSDIRLRSDKLLKHVIEPVVASLGLELSSIVRADKIGEPGRITTQIVKRLVESAVVIADLTDSNANVMYEVGIRQAMLKPLVLLSEKNQRLPFDLTDMRTIFYELELDGVEIAKGQLKTHLEAALGGSITEFDRALFSARTESNVSPSNGLLEVAEVCERILKETSETKEIALMVGNIVFEMKNSEERAKQERQSQEMSMYLMNQFFQNPEAFAKAIPAMKQMTDLFGAEGSAESKG